MAKSSGGSRTTPPNRAAKDGQVTTVDQRACCGARAKAGLRRHEEEWRPAASASAGAGGLERPCRVRRRLRTRPRSPIGGVDCYKRRLRFGAASKNPLAQSANQQGTESIIDVQNSFD